MKLTKKQADGAIEYYQIKFIAINLIEKVANVSMTHVVFAPPAVPEINEITYIVADKDTFRKEEVMRVVKSPQRDESGAILFDSQGNPLMVETELPQQENVVTKKTYFTDLVNLQMQSGTIGEALQIKIYQIYADDNSNLLEFVVE